MAMYFQSRDREGDLFSLDLAMTDVSACCTNFPPRTTKV